MSSTQQADETLVKSYRYLRTAMVGLVLCLTVAVIHQSLKQGTILSSISAYYFTSAQTIFVGALIAIGVCMIALRGTTDTDDILLNIGGMLAPVVAVVPTARINDLHKILTACRDSDGATFVDPVIRTSTAPTSRLSKPSPRPTSRTTCWRCWWSRTSASSPRCCSPAATACRSPGSGSGSGSRSASSP